MRFFSYFNIFYKRVKKEIESSINRVHSNKGDEFVNHSFITYCEEHGIKQEFSYSRSPQ